MSSETPLRADARRNRERLLAAAAAAFAAGGDVALDRVARDAGVGIGTLYRHFPSREALVEAVYRTELAALCAAADDLLAVHGPVAALRAWLDRYAEFVATKRGMADAFRAMVSDGTLASAHTRESIDRAVATLLAAGARAGTLRGDVEPDDVVTLLVGLFVAVEGLDDRARVARLLDLVCDGLRPRAPSAYSSSGVTAPRITHMSGAPLILVHGAFVDSGYWAETAEALRGAGREVVLVDLPGAGPDPDALGDTEADRAALRAAIDGAGGPVVLVAHSLGGFPVTALADHPAVVHTVYVASFVPREGEAPLQLLAEAGGPTDWVVPGEKAFATIDDTDRLREILLGDVEPERARRELARLTYQSAAGAMTPAAAPARTHPVTYVITDQDVAIPPAAQARFAEVAGASEVVHLPAAHQPMTSMPARLAAVLGAVG